MLKSARDFGTHYRAYAAQAGDSWRDMGLRLAKTRAETPRGYGVLEVGCGSPYPYVVLFHSAAVSVVGIDVLPLVRLDLRIAKYLDLRRARGSVSALRRLARDLLLHVMFDRPLLRSGEMSIRHSGVQLARMEPTRCGLADASFNVGYSSACFEYLPDVGGTVAGIDRLLKPNGIAEIEIDVFAGMTGGHERGLYSDTAPPTGFPLWAHFVDPEWKTPLFLNRWRDQQFRERFAARFGILDRQVTSRLGEEYLTRDLENSLSPRYSSEEVTPESVLNVLQMIGSAAGELARL